jgi:uracil-DNA glycosylase
VTRTLADVAVEASTCTKCRLSEGRTQVVFGVGDPHADLMFIGEGPGFHEDRQGEPFVGAAGQLLTQMLGEIGLARGDVYIANIVKCRPPANRDPLPDEIETCTPWLVEQISMVQPRVVVTLGNFATKFVLNTQLGITRLRGQVHDWHGRTVIPTFHPAAILHGGGQRSPQLGLLREDFALVRRTLDSMGTGVGVNTALGTGVGGAVGSGGPVPTQPPPPPTAPPFRPSAPGSPSAVPPGSMARHALGDTPEESDVPDEEQLELF